MIIKTFSLILITQITIAGTSSSDESWKEQLQKYRRQFENVGIIIPEENTDSLVEFRIPKDREVITKSHPLVVPQSGLPEVTKPAFCNDLDCPKYKLIQKYDGYEERLYRKSGWVSTTVTKIDLDSASKMMFYRLFDYIQGKNAAKEKIPMTAPVLTSIIPGQGPACVNNFTMSFYMPGKDPPQPTEETVFLDGLPQQRVFVKAFPGFADEKKWLMNAKALSDELARDGKKFKSDFFYSAGYDSPFRILNRHNEVWYLAK